MPTLPLCVPVPVAVAVSHTLSPPVPLVRAVIRVAARLLTRLVAHFMTGSVTRAGARSVAQCMPRFLPIAVARGLTSAAALVAALALVACSSTPAPPPQLYRLPLDISGPAAAPVNAPATALPHAPAQVAAGHWQLVRPVRLPEQLDQEALLLPDAGSGVLRMSGHRWVEPLRDAVPRVLMHDLGRLLGGQQVLDSPLPPGLIVAHQLRLDILALEATPGQDEVLLQARWSLADPSGRQPPQLGSARIMVPSTGNGAQAVVAAYRQALWQLAQQVVLSTTGSAAR